MNRTLFQNSLATAVALFALLSLTAACQSAQTPPERNDENSVAESAESGDETENEAKTESEQPAGAESAAGDRSSILPGRTGCIEGNCVNGEGVYVYSTRDVYRGRFENGKREGPGVFEYANGDKYEGNFRDNQRTGFGSYTFANGDKYVGEFSNGKLKGIGTYRFTDGTQLKGTFTENGTTGEGILVEDDTQSNEKGRDCTVENRLLFCRN